MTLTLIADRLLLMIVPAVLLFTAEAGGNMLEGSSIRIALLICVPMPLIVIGIFCTYQGVINTVRALSDRPVHYVLSILLLSACGASRSPLHIARCQQSRFAKVDYPGSRLCSP